MTQVLILMICTYRLIPCRVRRIWSMGTSSSHLALAALRAGSPAGSVLSRYAIPRLDSGWSDNRPMPGGRFMGKPNPDFPFKAGWDN